jgi:ankyrin repeat protein
MTPVHLAASKGHKDVTEVLLEAGASLSTVDKQESLFVTNLLKINIF